MKNIILVVFSFFTLFSTALFANENLMGKKIFSREAFQDYIAYSFNNKVNIIDGSGNVLVSRYGISSYRATKNYIAYITSGEFNLLDREGNQLKKVYGVNDYSYDLSDQFASYISNGLTVIYGKDGKQIVKSYSINSHKIYKNLAVTMSGGNLSVYDRDGKELLSEYGISNHFVTDDFYRVDKQGDVRVYHKSGKLAYRGSNIYIDDIVQYNSYFVVKENGQSKIFRNKLVRTVNSYESLKHNENFFYISYNNYVDVFTRSGDKIWSDYAYDNINLHKYFIELTTYGQRIAFNRNGTKIDLNHYYNYEFFKNYIYSSLNNVVQIMDSKGDYIINGNYGQSIKVFDEIILSQLSGTLYQYDGVGTIYGPYQNFNLYNVFKNFLVISYYNNTIGIFNKSGKLLYHGYGYIF